jgi:hypothetical protein
LLHWVSSDAVFGHWRAAESYRRASELEYRFNSCGHLIDRSGDDIWMQVSIGDVAPHREVKIAPSSFCGTDIEHLFEALDGHDDVCRDLLNAGVDALLQLADALIHTCRYGLPNSKELRGSHVIAWHGDLDRFEQVIVGE